jgi:hypothetical protein
LPYIVAQPGFALLHAYRNKCYYAFISAVQQRIQTGTNSVRLGYVPSVPV